MKSVAMREDIFMVSWFLLASWFYEREHEVSWVG